ncbi:MAG TPA: MarR family transcriptional regulator [Acidimicrobiales bacterium]|nr:MarR family transcriptional regulator [Acidimicrobiales bacterium]
MPTKHTAARRGVRSLSWMARSFESALGELGLSLPQYRLLSYLDQGDWAASALADHLSVSRPSVTSLADGLVAKGLVERHTSEEDRRRVLHELTASGRAALAAADKMLNQRVEGLLDRLPEDRRADAWTGLEALADAFDAARRERLEGGDVR